MTREKKITVPRINDMHTNLLLPTTWSQVRDSASVTSRNSRAT